MRIGIRQKMYMGIMKLPEVALKIITKNKTFKVNVDKDNVDGDNVDTKWSILSPNSKVFHPFFTMTPMENWILMFNRRRYLHL